MFFFVGLVRIECDATLAAETRTKVVAVDVFFPTVETNEARNQQNGSKEEMEEGGEGGDEKKRTNKGNNRLILVNERHLDLGGYDKDKETSQWSNNFGTLRAVTLGFDMGA